MNPILWAIQGILAGMFLMVGMIKIMQPKEKMAEKMGWMEDFSQAQIRGIGTLEILGALGLILPLATGILPILTPVAAVSLVLDMIAAFFTHLRRKEIVPMGVMNLVLMAMAAFVAYGRF